MSKPKLMVTTSWDDGHTLDIRLAALLKKYGIKGTFYISPFDREFKQTQLLTTAQIQALGRDFEIGAHTMTHPVLTRVPLEQAKQEISESKTYLEKITKQRVRSFCYPRGAYNAAIRSAVDRAGFRSARTVRRHEWTIASDLLAYGTTIHCYRHYSDVFAIARFSDFNPFRFLSNMNWETLAKRMFDHALSRAQSQPDAVFVFHLWGHSWEIDNHRDWEKLERVLAYIGRRSEVRYCTNDEAITVAKRGIA